MCIRDRSQAVTGARLDSLSDDELKSAVGSYSVYSRVQPEHKVRIVNAWKDVYKRQVVFAQKGNVKQEVSYGF